MLCQERTSLFAEQVLFFGEFEVQDTGFGNNFNIVEGWLDFSVHGKFLWLISITEVSGLSALVP